MARPGEAYPWSKNLLIDPLNHNSENSELYLALKGIKLHELKNGYNLATC
jgi:hypothetical protein